MPLIWQAPPGDLGDCRWVGEAPAIGFRPCQPGARASLPAWPS